MMRFTGSILLFAVLTLCSSPAAAQFPTVRLASVPSPEGTGLLRDLLPDFERESGYRVTVYAGEDLYDAARAGQADLVIAHYGHSGTEAFMNQGLGLWPRAVFANQIAIVGPASDPARIRGLTDATEAFRRIALGRSGARFVSNNSAIMKHLESVLWEAAGRPPKTSWYVESGASEAEGLAVAAQVRGYYIFALPPFLDWQKGCVGTSALLRPAPRSAPCGMEALITAGMPVRTMFASVVNPQRFPAVNLAGATALLDYLLRPAVQARVENFRKPDSDLQLWKGAAFINSGASLGFGRRP